VVGRSLELVRISSPVRPPRFFQINHVNVAISGTRLGLSGLEVICTSVSVTVLSAVSLIESQMHISFSFAWLH
jgi:hypothetical protein